MLMSKWEKDRMIKWAIGFKLLAISKQPDPSPTAKSQYPTVFESA